jgi:hypothetical protein
MLEGVERGKGRPMRLMDVLCDAGVFLTVCPACNATALLEARFFVSRGGAEVSLARLARRLSCTSCGHQGVIAGRAVSAD